MTSLGIASWLLAASVSQVGPVRHDAVPAPRPTATPSQPSRSPWDCRQAPDDVREENRDVRLRRMQIGFGVVWALGTAAVIGGAIGTGVTARDCIRDRTCDPLIASAVVLGVGIPVATTGLIGFAVSTGIRRGDRDRVAISLAPSSLRMRF